jgi:hypothetical protein
VCLAVAQVLLGARSEHHRLRMCRGRLGHLFPYLPHQPGYHKRLKAAAPLICKTAFYLATLCPSWADGLRLLDATPGALRHLPPDRNRPTAPLRGPPPQAITRKTPTPSRMTGYLPDAGPPKASVIGINGGDVDIDGSHAPKPGFWSPT